MTEYDRCRVRLEILVEVADRTQPEVDRLCTAVESLLQTNISSVYQAVSDKTAVRISQAADRLRESLGREPKTGELIQETGYSQPTIARYLKTRT